MLRLHIAEKWEPQDYLAAISAVETLYYVTLFARGGRWHELWEYGQPGRYRRFFTEGGTLGEYLVGEARALADRSERLIINEIRHSSPGFMDFDGVGQVAEALDRSFGRIIDVFTGRRLRKEANEQAKIETEIKRENLNSIKIDNARKLLDLYHDYPEIGPVRDLERTMVDQQTKIEALAARGLITDQRAHRD